MLPITFRALFIARSQPSASAEALTVRASRWHRTTDRLRRVAGAVSAAHHARVPF